MLSSVALMVISSQESHQEPEQKAVVVQSACVAPLLQAACDRTAALAVLQCNCATGDARLSRDSEFHGILKHKSEF